VTSLPVLLIFPVTLHLPNETLLSVIVIFELLIEYLAKFDDKYPDKYSLPYGKYFTVALPDVVVPLTVMVLLFEL